MKIPGLAAIAKETKRLAAILSLPPAFVAALAAFSSAAAAPPQDGRAQAQRAVYEAVDGFSRMYSTGQVVVYAGMPSQPCETIYAGQSRGKPDVIFKVSWPSVLGVYPDADSPHEVHIQGRGYNDAISVWPEKRNQFLSAARYLIKACSPVPVLPDPGARASLGKEMPSGLAVCRFVHVPALMLRNASAYSSSDRPAVAQYSVPSREDPSVRFAVIMEASRPSGAVRANWSDLRPRPVILMNKTYPEAKVSSERFADTGLHFGGYGVDPRLLINRRPDDDVIFPLQPVRDTTKLVDVLNMLDARSTLAFTAMVNERERRFTFDIGALRLVPQAVSAAGWTCPSK